MRVSVHQALDAVSAHLSVAAPSFSLGLGIPAVTVEAASAALLLWRVRSLGRPDPWLVLSPPGLVATALDGGALLRSNSTLLIC